MLTIEKKAVSVGKYVNTQEVDLAIRTYKKERWVHNSERLGKEDSLSGWYTVEELEQFIDTIKQFGADGIKFYFGAYPKDYAEKPEYAGLQTFVMVATKSKETEDGIKNKDVYVTKHGVTSILGYNATSLCPPYCSSFTSKGNNEFLEVGLAIVDKGADGMAVI